jgi:hypothetical protein
MPSQGLIISLAKEIKIGVNGFIEFYTLLILLFTSIFYMN